MVSYQVVSLPDEVEFYKVLATSVTKTKRVLLDKELIEERAGNSYFLDPVYERWFQRLIKR